MESLRIQITDTQKVRSDLMKWKLVIVAGLGAAGLGFQNTTFEQKHILLCFVPFVCIYVDALCAHLSLRIKAIGEFLVSREPKSEIEEYVRDYEKFLRISPPTFRLETIALHWTTIFFSILVVISGFVYSFPNIEKDTITMIDWIPIAVHCISGMGGIIITLWINRYHEIRKQVIIACRFQAINFNKGSEDISLSEG